MKFEMDNKMEGGKIPDWLHILNECKNFKNEGEKVDSQDR